MSRHVLLGRCALAKEFRLGGHLELHKSTLITEVNCCAWKGQGATNLEATFVMAAFKLGIWDVNQDARTQLAQIQTMPFPSVDQKMTVVWLVRVSELVVYVSKNTDLGIQTATRGAGNG
jgi:hypothetical protein